MAWRLDADPCWIMQDEMTTDWVLRNQILEISIHREGSHLHIKHYSESNFWFKLHAALQQKVIFRRCFHDHHQNTHIHK